MAELQAAWYGMRELSGVGARGDSHSVIQWMRSDKCSWKYLDMIDEIRAMTDAWIKFLAGPLAAYYKLPLDRVVLIFDDMNLPCGVLRLHQGGGNGRHNGLKSVIDHFRGNEEFARLRIGIGRPPGQMDPKAFLLQSFNASARERIDAALQEGVDALKLLIAKGLTQSAKCFNKEQKYKHIRVQTSQI